MGGGAQSKYQTHVFTTEKQLWCSGCYEPFKQPVKLGCGHRVCGPDSDRKCADEVLQKGKCLVANCGFQLPNKFDKKDFKKADLREKSEYDLAFPLDTIGGEWNENVPSTSREPESSARRDWETLKRGPKGFELVDNVSANGRKKLLVIGKTGTGKSTLCNVIAGLDPESDWFPVSSAAESCTKTTQFGNILFNGDRERPISLIDTIGFSDPDNDEDAGVISDLVIKLRAKCDYVNLFAIVVNGQNPRLDGSLVGMIRIFEEMFGDQFWKQVVVIFSRLPMDESNVARRARSNKMTDTEMAKNYLKSVEKRFPNGNGLKYLLTDAWYRVDVHEEKKCFDNSLSTLWDMLKKAPRLETVSVQNVETEHAKLKKMIADQQTQLLEAQKQREQDKEEREKDRILMKQEFERQREEDRKERLKERQEMEKRHLEQLAVLMSQKKEFESNYQQKESDLKLKLDLKLNQKDQEQDEMKHAMKKESDARQVFFENQLKSLREQQETLMRKFQQQGETDHKLRQQIDTLEKQQQALKNTHDKEKQKLEADYEARSKTFEEEKKRISNDFANQNKKLQEELEKLKSQTEVELRAKQLNELAERAKQNEISVKNKSPTKKERKEKLKRRIG
ncbi:uncharacterized protein LOC142345961 isoform X2 [Convolutriloba macropyga]|uniref:uncharacterized protein LOC142345961 isoform X2 n=1 Tax=Convolutriloba macropyga TaxID=536237 RepID=UPI003F51E6AC